MSRLTITDKTRMKRVAIRGSYDPETIYPILDEGLICHTGFVLDGTPFVIPTIHWRMGDRLYLHGSVGARMFKGGPAGLDLCVTVTLLDGLVLARSAFHHSMNYRSVMVFGRGKLVENPDEKRAALDGLVDHVIPGRAAGTRGANEREMIQTAVLWLPLDEASAKIRAEGVHDDKEDLDGPHWAGVIPLRLAASEPIADAQLKAGIETPDYAHDYTRPGWNGAETRGKG
jgi:hypothetical protein